MGRQSVGRALLEELFKIAVERRLRRRVGEQIAELEPTAGGIENKMKRPFVQPDERTVQLAAARFFRGEGSKNAAVGALPQQSFDNVARFALLCHQ